MGRIYIFVIIRVSISILTSLILSFQSGIEARITTLNNGFLRCCKNRLSSPEYDCALSPRKSPKVWMAMTASGTGSFSGTAFCRKTFRDSQAQRLRSARSFWSYKEVTAENFRDAEDKMRVGNLLPGVRQSGRSGEISVFPLTILIMDVPGFPSAMLKPTTAFGNMTPPPEPAVLFLLYPGRIRQFAPVNLSFPVPHNCTCTGVALSNVVPLPS